MSPDMSSGSIADVVSGQLDGLGSPEVTAREVAERKGRSPAELVQELAAVSKLAADLAAVFDDDTWEGPGPGGYNGTLGQGVEALWYDTYLHAQDVRAALGQPSSRGPGLRASVHHVAHELNTRGWGPATLAFDGIEEVPVGAGGAEAHRRRSRVRVGRHRVAVIPAHWARRPHQHLRVRSQDPAGVTRLAL